ncbi:MAG: hypothetical protein IKT12_04075 [Thermoguttaceae bacterium]|nr:hypothetical protein [Thermoguttaceae bacterium]
MNSKKRSSLWVWLFLLIFGIPSIGGRGLHLFLSEETACPSGVCCVPFPAEPLRAVGGHARSAAEETVFPVQAGPIPGGHNGEHCFLCHF